MSIRLVKKISGPTDRSEIRFEVASRSPQANGHIEVDQDTLPAGLGAVAPEQYIVNADIPMQDVNFPQVPVSYQRR